MDKLSKGAPAPREKSHYGTGVLGGMAILAGLWWWFAQPRFSDSDLAGSRADIRAQYEKKGLTVVDVTLVRVSDRKLEGFVKLKASALDDDEFTKSCAVTLGDDGHSFWRCQ